MSVFLERLQQAAAGENEPPPGERSVEVVGALDGPCDAVTLLPGRIVVAADVDQEWVSEAFGSSEREHRPEDRTRGLGGFVAAMVERLGGPPACVALLAVAPRRAALLRGTFSETGEPDRSWAPYRSEVASHHFDSPGVVGAVDIGRGPGGRWDTLVRVDGDARGGGGDSRQLLAAALTLVPRGDDLYVSAPVHDPRAMRTMLSGGFRPLGTELLFLTRPDLGGRRATGSATRAQGEARDADSGSWFSRLFRGKNR